MLWPAFQVPGVAAWGSTVCDLIYGCAVLTLTIGQSKEASVVARSRLGITVSVALAAYPFVVQLLPEVSPQTPNRLYIGAILILIPACLGLIISMRVAVAGTVPSPWRLVPLWVLGVQAALWVIPQVIIASTSPSTIDFTIVDTASALATLSYLIGTVGLGMCTVYVASTLRPESVEIYRSSADD